MPPERCESDPVLPVVAADDPGVSVAPLPSFDSTRPVASGAVRAVPCRVLTAGTPDDFERVLDVWRILLAAEMLGGAEACLALAVGYAKSRHQFDRPIGSFQAVKHACADMMIEIDATRAMVMYAAMCADDPAELRIAGPLVKAQAADTFLQCAGARGLPDPRRDRLHLGARSAPLLPQGPDQRGTVRRKRTEPGACCRPGRPRVPGANDVHPARLRRCDHADLYRYHP